MLEVAATTDAASPGRVAWQASAERHPLRLQLTPVGQGGVVDHAGALRCAWAERGRSSALWPIDRARAGDGSLTRKLDRTLAEYGAGAVELLLHYSGYGYDRRGLCGWLDAELAGARVHFGQRLRVVVMFHELFATGPPWRSAFWIGPWQAGIAGRLARQADAVVTNTEHHAAWIERATDRVAAVLPVFSNVGEPQTVSRLDSRTRHLVIFGSYSTRMRAWRALARSVLARRHLEALGVRDVVEVGPGDSVGDAGLPGGWRVHRLGSRSDAELSALLADSAFGLIEYPDVHLAKSSVYAAYAAHGCVVLNVGRCRRPADGLRPGVHYVPLADADVVEADRHASIADAARVWYGAHAIARQQAEFLRLLSPGTAYAA